MVLVDVVEGAGVVEATLAMTTMVVAVVEGGLITLAVVVVDGAQEAVVVAPLGVLVVPAEDLGVGMLLDGVELAVTATLVVAVEVPGAQLLVAQVMTRDGAAPKRPYQHKMVVAAGDPAVEVAVALAILDGAVPKRLCQHRKVEAVAGAQVVAVAGDEFVLSACCRKLPDEKVCHLLIFTFTLFTCNCLTAVNGVNCCISC
jgi:hypothetical protein